MNKARRTKLEEAFNLVDSAKGILEAVREEEQDAYENLPESFQNSGKGEEMQELNRELERTGVSIQMLLQRYKITSLEEMDRNIYRRALSGLRRTKSAT